MLTIAPRQANGKFHEFITARHGLDIACVLLGREHVVNDGAQLHFAPGAARLHIGHHALQVAHAAGQRLHLAQPLVHLLEPVADQLERFAQALLQRGVEFFVHRAAHFFELGSVVRLDTGQPLVQGAAQLLGRLVVVLVQTLQLLGQRLLQRRELLLQLHAALACFTQLAYHVAVHQLAQAVCGGGLVLTQAVHQPLHLLAHGDQRAIVLAQRHLYVLLCALDQLQALQQIQIGRHGPGAQPHQSQQRHHHQQQGKHCPQ